MGIRYKLEYGGKFVKDLKLAKRRGLDLAQLKTVTDMLQEGTPLPDKYRDHVLTGTTVGIESVTLIQTGFAFTAEKRPFASFLYTVQAYIQTCSNVCGFKILILSSIGLQIRYNTIGLQIRYNTQKNIRRVEKMKQNNKHRQTMKRIMILWAVLSLGLGAFAQPVEPPYTDDGELFRQLGFPEWRENRKGNESILLRDDSTVFSDVDVDPQYPGGIDSVYEWISRNFDYSGMEECCAIGSVIVSFIVETDGSITDVVKLRDIGCRIADRVVNAVSIMPKWIPGKLNDKAVRVRYVLPYSFFRR